MLTGERTLEEAARAAVSNWKRFDSFCWHRAHDTDDADDWGIFYTHHRDSTLLDQSNASVIEKALRPFAEANDPDVVLESHAHWAVGWIAGFSVRVFRNGEITEAFRNYHELTERLDYYPILDEDDYSRRETEATFANLTDAAWRLKDEFELPEAWEGEVYDWFSEHNFGAVENVDDRGGYPNEDELREAFESLGYEHATT